MGNNVLYGCILTTVPIKIVLESNFRVEMCELLSCDGEKHTYINIKLLFFPPRRTEKMVKCDSETTGFVCVCMLLRFLSDILLFYLTEASFCSESG